MKQVKNLSIAVIAFLAFTTTNAQSKMAHIDVKELMSKMPAVIAAQKEIKTMGETMSTTYKGMVDEYQAKAKKYDEEAATAGDAENQKRQVEVQDMTKRIQDYQESAQKQLQEKEATLLRPLQEKLIASIKKIAKLKGFQYVVDAAGLLVADGPDMMLDVKKDLGF